MDHLARQHEAAKLLVAAARQVAESIRITRAHYRHHPYPASAKTLASELQQLIQSSVQLTAAALQVSQEMLAQSRASRRAAKPATKAKPAARISKTKAATQSGHKLIKHRAG